ncbi:MAG: zinc-binding dehydrogenase [Planctomycetes bacterium]|nr:zinc-binding dehydrogenase [Planctomycetota bacterium]
MKALAFARNGGPDVLELMDLPVPEVGPEDVLVRVLACGLNHLDLWVRQGLPMQIPMPHIGGCETVGEIARCGSAVRGLTVGQRVMISPTQGCGRCAACHQGRDPGCREFCIPGEHSQGGFCEFAVASARHIIPLSNTWTPVEWAATPLVFLTAWSMLHRHGRIQPGDDVLVQGASSGVGSAAVQIARLAGARVFTTASTTAKQQLARDLGADFVIDSPQQSFAEVIKQETQGRGVDIVIEHVGQAVWKDSLKCLAHGGRLVTCGATTGPKVEIDLRFFFIREIEIVGACMGSRGELDQVLKLLDRRLLRPVVDRTFPLEQLAAAQQYLDARQQLGKVVIEVA